MFNPDSLSRLSDAEKAIYIKSNLKTIIHWLVYSYSDYELRDHVYNIILSLHGNGLSDLSSFVQDDFQAKFSSDIFANLLNQGYSNLPPLNAGCLSKIIHLVSENLCLENLKASDGRVKKGRKTVPHKFLHSSFDVLSVFSQPTLVSSIAKYFGIFPSIQYIASWENSGLIEPERTNEMYWHMDHHGHRFVKVFYYLSDVDFGFGHHEFISNTHYQPSLDKELASSPLLCYLKDCIFQKRSKRGSYFIPDDAISPLSSRLRQFTGCSGTGFIEDTRGLHRATVLPPYSTRLAIQATFVPFNNNKDNVIKGAPSPDVVASIKKMYGYSDLQVNKLFHLL